MTLWTESLSIMWSTVCCTLLGFRFGCWRTDRCFSMRRLVYRSRVCRRIHIMCWCSRLMNIVMCWLGLGLLWQFILEGLRFLSTYSVTSGNEASDLKHFQSKTSPTSKHLSTSKTFTSSKKKKTCAEINSDTNTSSKKHMRKFFLKSMNELETNIPTPISKQVDSIMKSISIFFTTQAINPDCTMCQLQSEIYLLKSTSKWTLLERYSTYRI